MYEPRRITHEAILMLLRQNDIDDSDVVRTTFTMDKIEVWRIARDENGAIKVTLDRFKKNPMPAYRSEIHDYKA